MSSNRFPIHCMTYLNYPPHVTPHASKIVKTSIHKKEAWNYLVPKRLDLAMKRTEDKFV